jgi:signal transduction histidine kinase
MSAPGPGPQTNTSESALAEVSALRKRMADLQTACEKALLSEAAMSLALAGLKRELNGPLSVLVLRVDLMLQEAEQHELPDIVQDDLALLQRHLERLRRVEAFVAATVEADRDGLFDLNTVLRSTIALVADRFEQRGIRVHTALAERLPPIAGNPGALGQVAMKLLINARDTVPAGGAVRVETARTNDRPIGVRLVVRTEGPGESFPDDRARGDGPGGSIVRSIVESHGGTIERGTRDGHRSTWTILLPVLLPGRNGIRGDR